MKPLLLEKNGRYYLRFRWQGKREEKALKDAQGNPATKHSVERAYNRALSLLEKGEYPFPQRLTLENWVAAYLKDIRSESAPRTLEEKRKILGYFVKWCDAPTLPDLTTAHLKAYTAHRLDAGRASRTVELDRAYLSHALQWAKRQGLIATNPAEDWPHIKRVKRFKDAVPLDVLFKVADKMPPYRGLAVRFQFATGIRPGELCALEWSDVHLSQRYATIETRKGYKARSVTFPASLQESLAYARMVSALFWVLADIEPTPYVFPKMDGGRLSTDRYYLWIAQGCKAANVAPFNPHRIRHTTATELLRRGVDVATARDVLGHHSLEVTNIYAHSNPIRIRQASDLLPEEAETRSIAGGRNGGRNQKPQR
jgi:integrase